MARTLPPISELARLGRRAVVAPDLGELHGPTLVRLWRTLHLPRGVRRDWEAKHPELRAAA